MPQAPGTLNIAPAPIFSVPGPPTACRGRTHVLTCCSPSEVGPTLAFESRGRLRDRQADAVTLRVRSQRAMFSSICGVARLFGCRD